jgi:hypothetical protein
VAPFVVAKKIMLAVPDRAIDNSGGVGGGGGVEPEDRVKLIVPSGFSWNEPTRYAAPLIKPVVGSAVPLGHDWYRSETTALVKLLGVVFSTEIGSVS